MELYFAPLEGIGGYIYRNTFHEFFGGLDKYFSPFIAAGPEVHFHKREIRDVCPDNNPGLRLIPQILTNHVQAFVETAKELQKYGYQEVNLNLGCPSRTVVSKGKGAGFLSYPKKLEEFLEQIFLQTELTGLRISIKTRLGMEDPKEFRELLRIYNQYPLEELIIHPRVQKDYYGNQPDWEMFGEAMEESKNPVCYNGNIFTRQDYENFAETFPKASRVMLGRGILANPGLPALIRGEKEPDKEQIRRFHDRLLERYRENFSGDKNVLFKMKELWCYLSYLFPDSEKYAKRIRKASHMAAYLEETDRLFAECEMDGNAGFAWKG